MMQLSIITHNQTLFEGSVSSLTVPGSTGGFQILTDHAPIISVLHQGTVTYLPTETRQPVKLLIEQGVLSVRNNKIKLLVEVS